MAVKSAPLSFYMDQAHASDRINRILVFRSCFNPAHLGHYELLHYGFLHSGADLNLLAAIVVPHEVQVLLNKFQHRDDALVLNMEERIRLWTGGSAEQWFRVFDDHKSNWNDFKSKFAASITEAGFKLEWVRLVGPDHIDYHKHKSLEWKWKCAGIVVSDCSWKAEFLSRESKLAPVTGFGAWEELELDPLAVLADSRQVLLKELTYLRILDPDAAQRMVEENPHYCWRAQLDYFDEARKDAQRIRTCRATTNSSFFVRFVQAQSAPAKISSMLVRKELQSDLSPRERLARLENLVVYPHILLEMVSWRQRYSEHVRSQSVSRKKGTSMQGNPKILLRGR
ncbi:MAG: hypothetical protein M1829_000353 [Trizodia sp. TS-e1964]|nr:MAG: hypothetical protein M1829_000353 [Trizodia sp. TS-e1964]